MKSDFSSIRAIIFDMDGVLFLSGNCHEQAFQETLKSIGISRFSYASIAGMRTDDAFRKVIADSGLFVSQYDIAGLVHMKRTLALNLLSKHGSVVVGLLSLLQELSLQYRLALVSSASPKSVDLFLSMSGCRRYFDCCLDGSLVDVAKPAPEIYLTALEKLKMTPEECIVIEDAISGVQAARNAGIRVIGVEGTDSVDKLIAAGAESVIPHVTALVDMCMSNSHI